MVPWAGGTAGGPVPGKKWLEGGAIETALDRISFRIRQTGIWITRTAAPKVYKAGAWVIRRPKRWTGSEWVDLE